MRYLLTLAACLSGATMSAARAEEWPKHGYYQVERIYKDEDGTKKKDAERYCSLWVKTATDGKPFAFILSEFYPRRWLAQVMALDKRLVKAKELWVGFDQKDVFHFTLTWYDTYWEISAGGEIPDSDSALRQLILLSKDAKWLQIRAAAYTHVIPTEGIKEALDDLAEYQKSRGT